MEKKSGSIIVTLIIAVVCSVSSVFLYDSFWAPKIYSFDVKGFLETQKQMVMDDKISVEDLDNNFNTLDAYLASAPKNYRILLQDVCVASVPNITFEEIQAHARRGTGSQ